MKLKVAFDVDDTLIVMDRDGRDVPNYAVIDILRWFRDNGHHVLVWSGGGSEYAQQWVDALGLGHDIRVCDKGAVEVDIAFDDGGFATGAEEQVAAEIRSAKVTVHV